MNGVGVHVRTSGATLGIYIYRDRTGGRWTDGHHHGKGERTKERDRDQAAPHTYNKNKSKKGKKRKWLSNRRMVR